MLPFIIFNGYDRRRGEPDLFLYPLRWSQNPFGLAPAIDNCMDKIVLRETVRSSLGPITDSLLSRISIRELRLTRIDLTLPLIEQLLLPIDDRNILFVSTQIHPTALQLL